MGALLDAGLVAKKEALLLLVDGTGSAVSCEVADVL